MDLTMLIMVIIIVIKNVLCEVDFRFVTRVSTGTRTTPVRNSIQCWNLCRKYRDCKVAQFNYRKRVCGLNTEGNTGEVTSEGTVESFINWHSQTEQPHRTCKFGSMHAFSGPGSICMTIPAYLVNIADWILLFRGTPGINKSVYDLWMDDTIFHDQPVDSNSVEPGCLTLMTSLHCTDHFRSKLISQWESANIEMVKYLILKDDAIGAEIVFDALGRNKTSWFDSARVLNSSWTDLINSSFNFFSIEGHPENRRFFINQNYGGCEFDQGWTTVIDRQNWLLCHWDYTSIYPRFLFSANTRNDLVEDHDYADAIVILAKING